MRAGFREVETRFRSFFEDIGESGTRCVPVEQPLEIAYGTVPYAVMMVTPDDIEDFVTGFSLTEGIVERASDIKAISIEAHPKGARALVALSPDRLSKHLDRQRSLTGRTGCGVCGITEIDALPTATRTIDKRHSVDIAAVGHAVHSLDAHQPLNDLTRAVHAAAWFDNTGAFVMSREDVGRHNALDKLIGGLMRHEIAAVEGFIVITSRCSFEMVEKAASFGASLLVAVSAPTNLAIERAKTLGITLLAIARQDGTTQFTGLEPALTLETCA